MFVIIATKLIISKSWCHTPILFLLTCSPYLLLFDSLTMSTFPSYRLLRYAKTEVGVELRQV